VLHTDMLAATLPRRDGTVTFRTRSNGPASARAVTIADSRARSPGPVFFPARVRTLPVFPGIAFSSRSHLPLIGLTSGLGFPLIEPKLGNLMDGRCVKQKRRCDHETADRVRVGRAAPGRLCRLCRAGSAARGCLC
jgi:hypothetical protein